jgi:mRNA interferase HigB
VRIIAFRTLREFYGQPKHRDSEQPLRAWYADVKKADWDGPNDIKRQYRSASIVGGKRAVFNIKGNDYRLIVAVDFIRKIVFVRFIGTHKDYDKVDALTV